MLELTSRIALLEIGRIAGIEEREARGLFDEARAVAERLQDKAGHAFLLTSYGRLCGLAGDVGQYLACAERATEFAEGSDAVFEFEMRSVLAHAQLAVGRLAPARATAERALTEVTQVAGLREAVGRSTALGLCRVWWALASSRTATSPRPRAYSSGRSRSLVIGAPRCGTSRASSRRSRTPSWPPVTAREPARSSLRRVSSSIGDEAGGLAPSMSRWRGFASWLRSPPPTAARSRARSSPWTPSRPSWAPIRIGALRRWSAHASRSHRGSRFPLPGKLVEDDMTVMSKREADLR